MKHSARIRFAILALALALGACTLDNPKRRFILADKLWSEKKYEASEAEFEKIATRDPNGELGLRALYRAAVINTTNLGRHQKATELLRKFMALSNEKEEIWQAKQLLVDIFFEYLEKYPETIELAAAMVSERPADPRSAELQYRIARSLFFMSRFGEAKIRFEALIKAYSTSQWAERAQFDLAMTRYTQGAYAANDKDAKQIYGESLAIYEKFIKDHPNSRLMAEAKFGMASCYEELEQLDSAYEMYRSIATEYPSPNVIAIKLARIGERRLQKGSNAKTPAPKKRGGSH